MIITLDGIYLDTKNIKNKGQAWKKAISYTPKVIGYYDCVYFVLECFNIEFEIKYLLNYGWWRNNNILEPFIDKLIKKKVLEQINEDEVEPGDMVVTKNNSRNYYHHASIILDDVKAIGYAGNKKVKIDYKDTYVGYYLKWNEQLWE